MLIAFTCRARMLSVALSISALALCGQPAPAAILGFTPGTYAYNQIDAGSPAIVDGDSSIQLTTGGGQNRSIWFYSPQNISSFTASFKYESSEVAASFQPQGLTFALQASPAGTAAQGLTPPGSGNLGYGGIPNSAAVAIALDTGSARTFSGAYTGGILGGGLAPTDPANGFNNALEVLVTYNGSLLSVAMTQGANTFGPQNYLVGNLTSVLGSSTAYVGFTAATEAGANQWISDLRFVPEPSSLALAACGGLGLAVCLRRQARRSRESRN